MQELFGNICRCTFDKDFHAGKSVSPALLNEDGTPKKFYHGAKRNGGFTEFREWQYFTDQKKYAERYTERGNPNSLYEVYLTADKIFDTRDARARKIFEQIRQEYGLGEIQDTGLPDWTDGYDITDYLENHPELGYDAILLDEGGDLVNGEPVSRGISIVIKNAEQVKSATDNIGTFNRVEKDIRYSISDEELGRYADMRERMETYYRTQMKLAPDYTMTGKMLENVAERFLEGYTGRYSDIMKRFSQLSNDIQSYARDADGIEIEIKYI